MMTSMNCYKNALKARAYGKPFYAADLGLNGGEINGLSLNQFIKPTGNIKTAIVPAGTDKHGNRLLREVTIKEWIYCNERWGTADLAFWGETMKATQERELAEYAELAKEFLRLLDTVGGF